jgi:hypothetical protein
MTNEHNIKPIKKGDTFVFPLEFYSDECETTAIDVSTYVFKLMAKNSALVTQFTWSNADFVSIAINKRTVTLSAVTTATYTAGEFVYELQVTTGTGTYTWMQGYVSVVDQITS